jgi:hypothetical protein
MVVEITNTERGLSDTEVRELLAEGLGRLDLVGRRVLVVIPDGTRTAPIGLFFGLLGDLLGSKVEALDYLIALGTHPPMDDAAKGTLHLCDSRHDSGRRGLGRDRRQARDRHRCPAQPAGR